MLGNIINGAMIQRCYGNSVVFQYKYYRTATLISSSDALVFHNNNVHSGRNIHITVCVYKKQYISFNVLYDVSLKCQNSSQCSEIEYQTFICPIIFSAKYIHTVHIPCLCSVNNM